MKVIIAGSRFDMKQPDLLLRMKLEVMKGISDAGFEIKEIVSGTAQGFDRLGELYAKKFNIPVTRFPADWNQFGKGAGFIRNSEMADYADGLIAFWDGVSRGTRNMIQLAEIKNLKVHVHRVNI